MSLFPAYAEIQNTETKNTSNNTSEKWLENTSFKVEVKSLKRPNEIYCKSPEPKRRKDSKHYKHKHKKIKKSKEKHEEDFTTEHFSIDLKGDKEFLSVKTISRPSVPKYCVKYFVKCYRSQYRKKKFKRYHQTSYQTENIESNSEEGKIITKKNIQLAGGSKVDENFTGFQQEEDLTHTTAIYNKKLGENSQDVKLWLEYVKFQDVVYQFEKTYRKGSIAKGLRVLAERKLLILDKALSFNPECVEIQRERLNVAVSCYPADELQTHLQNLVDKDQGNIILWQGYIESTQCSMSHCNTPTVLKLYSKCLSILHKLRRNATIEKALLEENILKMLYQCGLFLKQAGLFEQLWTLLRLYLELNLSPTDQNKFNISSGFQDKLLVELEDVVFNSQLPLHELWLRTEKLRESCHWLPFTEDGDCEDPQRLVFPEDVSELIHPITMPENMFKLISTILSLMKIPLLPCRHTTMQVLGLDYVPWALDSIESILPIFLSFYPIDLNNGYLTIDPRLCVGPQYLNCLPGQEEYLDFVLKTMKSCTDCLSGHDKTATCLWWMRFQKLLIVLEKQGRFKLPSSYSKKIKGNIKNFLKLDENRNTIVYYCEYALVEYELGNVQSCLNILQAALNFTTNQPILASNIDENQIARCILYKTLIELNVKMDSDKKEILKIIIGYVLEKTVSFDITEELLQECSLKLKHITCQLLQKDIDNLNITGHFLPNFTTDWIMINGWFLYLTKGPINCGKFIEDILSELDEKEEKIMWEKEVLYEFYVSVLFKYCTSNPGSGIYRILDDVLHRSIQNYPNNLFLLAVLAKLHSIVSCAGTPWWKLKNLLIKTGRAFPTLFLVLIGNQQIMEAQKTLTETTTGKKYEITESWKNRMLSLFRRITKPDMCTRRCGLVWRLYLQFVHAYFDPALCRNVYYSAVEECPWLKALYIDAAIYIPAELAKIQDLLIEKQLRLHVTPEELDVLRS